MRKYIRKISFKIPEAFRAKIYNDLLELLDEDNYHIEHRNIEKNVVLSILTSIDKKLNKNLEQRTRAYHKFNLKYHEAWSCSR